MPLVCHCICKSVLEVSTSVPATYGCGSPQLEVVGNVQRDSRPSPQQSASTLSSLYARKRLHCKLPHDVNGLCDSIHP
eukprot:5218249-Amphidinium_carterae.1